MVRLSAYLLCLSLIVPLGAIYSFGADIRLVPERSSINTIARLRHVEITGQLDYGDEAKLAEVLRRPESMRILSGGELAPLVLLNSTGGNVTAAVKMGDMLRAKNAHVAVMSPHECSSACVFLLASGVTRLVFGDAKIGIHRPYFTAREFAVGTARDARESYADLESIVRTYLARMGMPGSLYERMRSIPSANLVYLSQAEIEVYTLDGKDPAIEELELAQRRLARTLGHDERLREVMKDIDLSSTTDTKTR